MRNRLDWLAKCSLFYLLLNLVQINFIFSDDVRLLYMSSIDFSELPRNAKLVCDNGQVYDARHRCLLDMNEYGDIKYCRDMSHLQQCGKIIHIKHRDNWHREAWKKFEDTSGVIGRHKFNIFLAIYSNLPDFCNYFILFRNRIGGVMVSALASSAVELGFGPKTVKLVFVASPLSTQY